MIITGGFITFMYHVFRDHPRATIGTRRVFWTCATDVNHISWLLFQQGNIYHGYCSSASKQPIRARYLVHVTGYQPIRDQYLLVYSGAS